VWQTPELRSTLLLTLIVGTFAINSPVVLPLLAKVTFGGNAGVYSWMSVAMGAGALFGALFVANRTTVRGSLVFKTALVFGVATCVAALAPSLGVLIGLLVVVGAGQIAFLATCNSQIQLRADPVMRGRVMAVYTIAILGSTPIGGPIVGWVCQVFGPRWGLALGGIATIAGALVFGTAFVRARRRDAEQGATPVVDDEIVLGVDGESIPVAIR
jgi:MFS family permease